MADVTNSFVPSVTTAPLGVSPMTAQPVQPMQNAAPGQMQQVGAATEHLGLETQDIGERIQNQLDDAMAKQAETKFLQNVNVIANGDGKNQPGYLHLQGQDAINALPDAQAALAQAKQAGADSLSSDFQKAMYNRVVTQHLISYGAQFVDHHFNAIRQYSGEESVNRATMAAQNGAGAWADYGQVDADGNKTGDLQKNYQIGIAETDNASNVIKGVQPDSATAAAARLSFTTQLGTGALVQAMDANPDNPTPYTKVQRMFDGMKADGWIDQRSLESMEKMVEQYSVRERGRTFINQDLSDAWRAAQGKPTTSTGTPDYQNPIKGSTITAVPYNPDEGGVELNIPQSSKIQAPADGQITAAGRNGDDVPYLALTHPDGSVTTLTGITAYNVKVGDQVQRGENIATSGSSGNQKNPSVFWSLADKNGNAVDPTKVGLPPVDTSEITDENVLHGALDKLRQQITDPAQQQQATAEMERIVRVNQQNAAAAQTQIFKQASDAFYSGGEDWRKIPPSIAGQLTPEQLQHFKDTQTEKVLQGYEQQQRFKTMSETDIVSGFFGDPATLTPDNVETARSQLSNSTYLSLMEKATTLQNNPKGVQEAQAVNDRIKYFAEQAGMNVQGTVKKPDGSISPMTPSAEDKQKMTGLQFKVLQDIDQLKAQNHGKATPDQVDSAIKNELVQRTLTTPRSAWNPLRITNISPNVTTQKYNFEMPGGATVVVRGSDGKMHYSDGKNDLGVVQ